MSSGSGRGRGWLNLNKNNTNPPQPGVMPQQNNYNESQFEDAYEQYTPPPTEFGELINRIQQLNLKDDGILFNQKIKFILDNWSQECKSKEIVERSFDVIYDICLQDEDLSSKLILMISSRTFLTQEVSGQNIRNLFLNHLQANIENGSNLQKMNPQKFRNSVLMLSEFYHKARLANGAHFTFLKIPLLTCLNMLLEKPNLANLSLFTKQIYLNGIALKKEAPQKLNQLLIEARNLLINGQLEKESKGWLLLAIDISNNNFGPIASDLFEFYENILGSTSLAMFQKQPSDLTIQTNHVSKALDSFTSHVNVLQVSTDIQNKEVSPQEPLVVKNSPSINKIAQKLGRTSGNNSSNGNGSGNGGGRPILGSGARLNKTEDNWNLNGDKNGGGGRKKNGFIDKKATRKGWEHDDRFDNDYS